MKVLLYTENEKILAKSGLGKAIKHQQKALEDNKIEYTTDPKCKDYDIIHLNFYGPKSYFLAKKAKKQGKKVVYHAHSTEEDFKNSFIFSNQLAPLFKWWISKCYRLGDIIICPTPYTKKLLEKYNLNRPIIAISNGIDLKQFEKDEELGKKFREYFKFKETDKIIMSCGIYINRKGIIDFVELAKRLPQYKFVWFGSSPLKYSPKEIKEAVNTKLDNLIFPGYVPFDILKGGYSGSDLFLFPTYEENEGIPIMEAATSRLKILTRDIPVFEDWIIDKKDVYKAKNIDEFESLAVRILENKLPDLRDNAYIMANTREITKVGKQLIEVYESLMKK